MLLLGIALGMSKGEAGAVVTAKAGGRAFRPWKKLRAYTSKALIAVQPPALKAQAPLAPLLAPSLEPAVAAEASAIVEVMDIEVTESVPMGDEEIFDILFLAYRFGG